MNMSPRTSVNHYVTLDLPENATQEEIKAKYRSLVLKFHPDVNNNTEESRAHFLSIREAFEILGNENSRKKYDDDLKLVKWTISREPTRSSRREQGFSNHFWDDLQRASSRVRFQEWWMKYEKEVVKANKEVTEASRVFYPTNQKLDNLNSDQIYFKNRLERIQAGGKWNFRKFSTLFRRHCFS